MQPSKQLRCISLGFASQQHGQFREDSPGVFWDKKKRDYRTNKRNAVFELLDRVSIAYADKKGLPLEEAVPLYGQWDNYRTNFDDFREVYLFGNQVDNRLSNEAGR